MKKSLVCVFLALCLVLSLGSAALADGAAREFTDSTGRTVTLPAEVTRIAVSGPLAQVYIIPIAGDMMVGVSNAFSSEAELYLPEYIINANEIGQLYGGKGEMDLEALLAAAPDVVIDVGETKSSTK